MVDVECLQGTRLARVPVRPIRYEVTKPRRASLQRHGLRPWHHPGSLAHQLLNLGDLSGSRGDVFDGPFVRDYVFVLDSGKGLVILHSGGSYPGDESTVCRRVGKGVQPSEADVDPGLEHENVAHCV